MRGILNLSMKQNTITTLVNNHQWTALIELIGKEEMVLKFPDADSLESFRVMVYKRNAYGREFNLSVCRSEKEIRISKCQSEGEED